jgi:hypothetical protein
MRPSDLDKKDPDSFHGARGSSELRDMLPPTYTLLLLTTLATWEPQNLLPQRPQAVFLRMGAKRRPGRHEQTGRNVWTQLSTCEFLNYLICRWSQR